MRKTYLGRWYDYHKMNYMEIEANSYEEAKSMFFREMCKFAGDRIYRIDIFEMRKPVECNNEYNPYPLSAFCEHARRDYLTGNVCNRAK